VNFYRALGKLQPVALDDTLSAKAMQAALMMEAAAQLSHSPAPSWPCYTADGALAASKSNLALGVSGAAAMQLLMDEPGNNNFAVGHRRWMMYPYQTLMGTGSTALANALYVVDTPSWRSNLLATDPEWMTWPTSGFFPWQAEPNGRWSLYANTATLDFANATLTVTRHDGASDVVFQPTVLTRTSMLVWQFDAGFKSGMADRTYTVRVENMLRNGVATTYSYDVTMFDPEIDRNQPARLLDTRVGQSTIDQQFNGIGLRGIGSTTELQVTDRATVPLNTDAAIINVTVTDARAPGFVTVFPCGSPRPTASNLNFVKGSTVANVVIAKVGDGGKVCIFSSAQTHLVADINGFYSPASGFSSMAPARLLETRSGLGTVDDQFNAVGLAATGSTVELTVAGRAGVPANASTVALNVTATEAQLNGYITVFPCGQPQPNASNLNYQAGGTAANAVVAKVGDGGKVCLFASAATHLIVDISGYFAAGQGLTAMTPARLLETRAGLSTTDGQLNGIGPRAGGETSVLQVAGRGGVPLSASTVVLNVTATEAVGPGFITVFPCGQSQPLASNLNVVAGKDVANTVIAKLGTGGTVCIFTMVGTHLVVDVNGYALG
jgi:hypothetical protein